MPFCDQVRDANQRVVLYEVIPPPEGTLDQAVQSSLESLQELCRRVKVNAINIPEVRRESHPGERSTKLISKIEPRQYGQLIQQTLSGQVETIVNRGVVYQPLPQQREWLRATWEEYDIHNLILVGGESGQTHYPGPSVTEAARLITAAPTDDPLVATDYFCGGITIPARREEPARLITKAQHGLEFFTSQVLYEARSTKALLQDYAQLCRQRGETPRRIFLSFAPVSSGKDIEFLKWLGVEMPAHIEHFILDGWIGVAWRSIKIACQVLDEILGFVEAEGLNLPLGLNIEHVMRHNFEASREMTAELSEVYVGHSKTHEVKT